MANTIINFGNSDTGKTTQMRLFFKYEYERTGKRGRFITAEEYGPMQPLINTGIVDVLSLRIIPIGHRFSSLRKLAIGGWPKNPLAYPPDPVLPDYWVRPTIATWQSIGYYGAEGLTSISDWLMEEARTKEYCKGEGSAGGTFEQDGEKFSNQSRSQYLLVQKEMQARIVGFAVLPVDRVMFTAHEVGSVEDITGNPIAAPAMAGKGGAAKLPSWVGDCLHTDLFFVQRQADKADVTTAVMTPRRRMFFQSHPDPRTGAVYNCKPRVPIEKIPALLERWPHGYLETRVQADGTIKDGLDEYLRVVDRLYDEASDSEAAWKKAIDERRAAK